MNDPYQVIDIAIEQAKKSLCEGNSGFGVVIIRDNVIISRAHDTDKISKDPSAHAEINAIRQASKQVDGDFRECMLVSTHEPCPMCATAIVWAGFKQVAFGYSIIDALNQGRKRINISCRELFARAGALIEIIPDVKKRECGLLYNEKVRTSIDQLRHADSEKLACLAEELKKKRISWIKKQKAQDKARDPLDAAYELFLKKLGITADEAPVADRQKNKLVIHSKNFCPTLEACKILDIDTRVVCKQLSEEPTQALLQQIDPKIRFKRNYDLIRPYKPYCEEMIIMDIDR